MKSLLTYYDEKLHMKTVRREGYEDGYDARQPEIDALTAAYNDKDAELANANATLDRITREFEEYKRLHK